MATTTTATATTTNINHSHGEDDEEKHDEILACLNGTDDQVDLWHLRTLCLQPGGLLSSAIRKRAWPKLMAAHNALLLPTTTNTSSSDWQPISNKDLLLLQRHVSESDWQMEEQVSMARHDPRQKRVVSFVPDAGASPRSVRGTISPNSQASFGTGTVNTATSIKSSHQDQQVVMHIIITMLRQPTEDCPHFEDDRFHYYQGLVDVAALLLINVESPSLASIVLCQLATFHLRDASRTPSMLEPAVRAILPPLLHHVDPILYQALSSSLEAMVVDFCVPWIQSWGSTTAHGDVRLQSRLADVFLASHAVMPIYVCAAFLVHHRTELLNTKEFHFCTMETMEEVEHMIGQALSYLQRLPPTTDHPHIAMLQPAPAWATLDVAPTDYALLKALRNHDDTSSATPRCPAFNKRSQRRQYPLATVAAGIQVKSTTSMSAHRTVMWITWGVAVLVITLALYPSLATNYKVTTERRRVAALTNSIPVLKRSDVFINKSERRKIQKMIQRREEKRQLQEGQQRKEEETKKDVKLHEKRSKLATPDERGQETKQWNSPKHTRINTDLESAERQNAIPPLNKPNSTKKKFLSDVITFLTRNKKTKKKERQEPLKMQEAAKKGLFANIKSMLPKRKKQSPQEEAHQQTAPKKGLLAKVQAMLPKLPKKSRELKQPRGLDRIKSIFSPKTKALPPP